MNRVKPQLYIELGVSIDQGGVDYQTASMN